MATIYAKLVSSRTQKEYMELVDFLSKKIKDKEYELSIKLAINNFKKDTGVEFVKGEPYYQVVIKDKSIIAKTAEELKEKIEILAEFI
jgi:hypothetical protein